MQVVAVIPRIVGDMSGFVLGHTRIVIRAVRILVFSELVGAGTPVGWTVLLVAPIRFTIVLASLSRTGGIALALIEAPIAALSFLTAISALIDGSRIIEWSIGRTGGPSCPGGRGGQLTGLLRFFNVRGGGGIEG